MEPQTLRRAVRDAFRDILGNASLSGPELTTALESAGSQHGVEPFLACLQVLSAAPRGEAEARRTIEAIEAHRQGLREPLGRDPGFAVAAADYLQTMEGQAWRTSLRLSGRSQAADPREGALDAILASELRRSVRLKRPLSLVLLAADRGGLDARAVRAAGAALRESARGVDRTVRLLPEGFAMMLPCTPGEDAVRAAARLRAVAEHATGGCWSAGVAAVPGVRPEVEAMAASARAALSLARAGGGGAVCQGAGDRRRMRRRAVGSHLSGSIVSGGRELPAGLQDLSLGGALVHLGEEIGRGTRVLLTMRETTARARVAAIPGRVVRTIPPPAPPTGGRFQAALAFDSRADARRQVAEMMAAIPAADPGPRA